MSKKKPQQFYIIDDDPIFVEMMTDILEDEGFSVSSNCAALYSLSEIRKLKPDCILVDLQMSEMDGLELCLELQKMPQIPNAKIIMVSAHDDDIWKRKANEAGANGYITKPIDAASFLSTIERIVGEGA